MPGDSMAIANLISSGLPPLLDATHFDFGSGQPGIFPQSWGLPSVGLSLSDLGPAASEILNSGMVGGALGGVISPMLNVLQQASGADSQWGIWNAKTGEALGDPGLISPATGSLFAAAGSLAGSFLTGNSGPTISTRSVEYQKEFRISNFPIEKGTFADYNKVETPAEPRVVLAMGGFESDRADFLSRIDAAAKSFDLFNIATPEQTYLNYAISRYNYQRRASRGAGMIIVELALTEIREVSPQYSQVQQPQNTDATPPQDSGATQAKTPEQASGASTLNQLFGGPGQGLGGKAGMLLDKAFGQNPSLTNPNPGVFKASSVGMEQAH